MANVFKNVNPYRQSKTFRKRFSILYQSESEVKTKRAEISNFLEEVKLSETLKDFVSDRL